MKNIYFIIFCLLLLSACQSEEDIQIIDQNIQLDATSPLTSTLKRVSQDSTAFDNFIDGSSKIRVNFPFEVTVNQNTTVSLDEEVRYSNLIQILEATPQQDNIQLNFPINVSTIDYVSQNLNSSEELSLFLENLTDSSEINCVELFYPFDIRFFDPLNSSIDNQRVFNRAQFFNFLNDLDTNGLFYEFDYPIEVIAENAEGQFETVINTNAEFNSILMELPESCFEPLLYENNPSGTNPTDLETFVEFITNGQFEVSELIDEGEPDSTYEGLIFTFEQDDEFEGDITVDQEDVGVWSAVLDDGVIVFELDFETSFFEELDEDWDVVSFDEDEIQLIDISSDGDTSTLVFSRLN